MSCKNKTITSEYVSWGHPDKLADQIADQILTDISKIDPNVRAGIEVMVKDNIVVLGGEITTTAKDINYELSVKKVFEDISYPSNHNLTSDKIKVINLIGKQSPEISSMVDKSNGILGAGDQGFMVGYASYGTDNLMPLGHYLARTICEYVCTLKIPDEFFGGDDIKFGPDVKTQVVITYDEDNHPTIDHILISSMHPRGAISILKNVVHDSILDNSCGISEYIFEEYIKNKDIKIDVNPYGEWTIGGPISDCGVTGRKIVVDAYGGYCNVGGGATSGKDLSKVDRSGAYMARYIAKNIVATGIADEAKVELAYVIGDSKPCALNIELDRNCHMVEIIKEWLEKHIDMSPSGIIERFMKNRSESFDYVKFAKHGSYGHEPSYDYPWEKLDFADELLDHINQYVEDKVLS